MVSTRFEEDTIRGHGFFLVGAAALVLAGSASASGEPKHSFKAADQALARWIVLRPADLGPHFIETISTPPDPERQGPRCKNKPDESDLTLTGTAVSQVDRRGQDFPDFYSGASIFLSPVQARRAFQREMTSALANCLEKRFKLLEKDLFCILLCFQIKECFRYCLLLFS